MSSEGRNLEAISLAIDQHNANCVFPALEVHMNPFEVERLGWTEIRGLPVIPDDKIGTGRFKILCARDLTGGGKELPEEVEVPTPGERELVPAGPIEGPVARGQCTLCRHPFPGHFYFCGFA